MTHRMTVRLSDKQKLSLDVLAQGMEQNLNEIIRRAIDDYIMTMTSNEHLLDKLMNMEKKKKKSLRI